MSRTQVPNVELARDTARDNLLTNGGFEIWQRGNGPFTAQGAYTADRWELNYNGAAPPSTITRLTSSIYSPGSSAQVAYTFGAGTSLDFRQRLISGSADFTQLGTRTLTFSVGVKSSVVGTVRALAYDGTAYQYSGFNTTTTGERLSVTFTTTTNPVTVLVGINISVASCTVEMNDAMLVVGSVAADYAPLHPADDLARCLRYYELLGDQAGYFPLVQGYNGVGGSIYNSVPFKAKKAVAPTVTKNGTWTTFNTSQPTLLGSNTDGSVVALVATAAGYAYAHPTAAGQNITIEANP